MIRELVPFTRADGTLSADLEPRIVDQSTPMTGVTNPR